MTFVLKSHKMATKSIEFLKISRVSWCKQVFLLVFLFWFWSWEEFVKYANNYWGQLTRNLRSVFSFQDGRENLHKFVIIQQLLNQIVVVVVFEDSSPFSYFLLIYDNFIGQLKSSRSSMLLMLMYYARAFIRRRRCVCAVRDVIAFVLIL